MLYKTIAQGLIEARPKYHQHLQQTHQLLKTIENLATDLMKLHMQHIDRLKHQNPDSSLEQVSSEAAEMAICDLQLTLPSEEASSAE
jgi:type II secretory pathway component PulM